MKVQIDISDYEVPFTDVAVGGLFLYNFTLWIRLDRYSARDFGDHGCCVLTLDKDTHEPATEQTDYFLKNAISPWVRPAKQIMYLHGA